MSVCCANCYYVYSARFAYCPDCGSEKRMPPPARDATENAKDKGESQ